MTSSTGSGNAGDDGLVLSNPGCLSLFPKIAAVIPTKAAAAVCCAASDDVEDAHQRRTGKDLAYEGVRPARTVRFPATVWCATD